MSRRPRFVDLTIHLSRLMISALVIAFAGRASSHVGMVIGSGMFFLEAFALSHDLMHGALHLSKRTNDAALAVAGALLLMSGHALQSTHRIHHARSLASDDLEGAPARQSLARALFSGPLASLRLRGHAFVIAKKQARAWQIVETAGDLGLGALLLVSGRSELVVYALVALFAQITMGVWAAYVPHNAPAWLTGMAERLTWTGSPTMLSLAHHELHHAHPGLPCRHLAAAARLR